MVKPALTFVEEYLWLSAKNESELFHDLRGAIAVHNQLFRLSNFYDVGVPGATSKIWAKKWWLDEVASRWLFCDEIVGIFPQIVFQIKQFQTCHIRTIETNSTTEISSFDSFVEYCIQFVERPRIAIYLKDRLWSCNFTASYSWIPSTLCTRSNVILWITPVRDY